MSNTDRNSVVLLFLVSSSVFVILLSPAVAVCVPRNASSDDHGSPSVSTLITPTPTAAAPTLESSLTVSGNGGGGGGSGGSFMSGNHGILDRVCGSTDYKLLCMSTLAPVIHDQNGGDTGPTTVRSILQVAINVAVAETKLAMTVIDGLIKATANENAKSALGDCTDSYDDALDNFQAASDAMGKWDLGTINSMLSACITSFSDCDDELTGVVTDFVGHGEKLMHMTSNCLAIASVVR